MEQYIVALLDPVLVVPAFCIGVFAKGPLRLWLAGLMMAAYPIIALGYGVNTPTADALLGRALAAGSVIVLGVVLSRRRVQPVQAGRKAS